MELTREDKELVAKKLVEAVLTAVQKDELTTEDMPKIAKTFLSKVDSLSTQGEIVTLLKEMSSTWPVLASLSIIEDGKIKDADDETAASNVETLVKSGQINEALNAAKAATQT